MLQITAIIIILVFFRIELDQKGVRNIQGALFLLVSNISFSNLFSVINVCIQIITHPILFYVVYTHIYMHTYIEELWLSSQSLISMPYKLSAKCCIFLNKTSISYVPLQIFYISNYLFFQGHICIQMLQNAYIS